MVELENNESCCEPSAFSRSVSVEMDSQFAIVGARFFPNRQSYKSAA